MSDARPIVSGLVLRKTFGGVEALSGVSLELSRGECVGLAGDNGAGKSTLLKLLTGVHTPTSGELFFDGVAVHDLTPARAMAFGIEVVYQDLALADNLSAIENIFLGREIARTWGGVFSILDRARMAKRAEAVLADLGVHRLDLRAPVQSLSGGQRQMVAIARSMTFSPRVVILDEPTAALSARASAPILNLIRELPKRGVSVLLVSHRIGDLLTATDRIYVLRHGKNAMTAPTSRFSEESLMAAIAGVASHAEFNTPTNKIRK